MSESQTAATEQASAKPHGGNPVRLVVRIILFGILIYLVCALPYDFFVARAGQAAAWKKLYNEKAEQTHEKYDPDEKPGLLQVKNLGAKDVEATNETVAELLGKTPSRSEENKDLGQTVETFSWRGGLPWRSYNIYVVYSTRKGKLRVENAFLNADPYDELSVPSNDPPVDAGEATPPADGPQPIGPGGRPSPGGLGPPGGGTPPDGDTKRPDAEEPTEKKETPKDSEAKPAEKDGDK